jgi:hypothetical protein
VPRVAEDLLHPQGMSDDDAAGQLVVLAHLLDQQRRQGDSIEKLVAAAQTIAEDLNTIVATSLTAALVYPWAHDPSVVRVVLIRTADDERRLRETLERFETGDRTMSMEEALKKEGFTLLTTKQVSLARKGIGTYKATAAHAGLGAPPAPAIPTEPLHLETEAR